MRSEVELARQVGRCFGVRRAVEQVESLVERPRQGRLVSLGPLVHNRLEVERLRGLGLIPIADVTELQPGDEVVVRTHGVTPAELRALRGRAAAVHDATCPYVRSLQVQARRLATAGYAIVLVGDRYHPEVQSVLAWAGESAAASRGAFVMAIGGAAELRDCPPMSASKIAVLAQTTQAPEQLREVAAACLAHLGRAGRGRKPIELRTLDTTCACTRERQTEARELAARVDLMLIAGDRESANTRRLHDICRAVQPRSELVADPARIDERWLRGVRRVGVVGGASTPSCILRDIVSWLNNLEHE